MVTEQIKETMEQLRQGGEVTMNVVAPSEQKGDLAGARAFLLGNVGEVLAALIEDGRRYEIQISPPQIERLPAASFFENPRIEVRASVFAALLSVKTASVGEFVALDSLNASANTTYFKMQFNDASALSYIGPAQMEFRKIQRSNGGHAWRREV